MFCSALNLMRFLSVLLVGFGFASACIRSPCPDPDGDERFGGSPNVPDLSWLSGCLRQTDVNSKKNPYFANVAYKCGKNHHKTIGVVISNSYVLAKVGKALEGAECDITVTIGANSWGIGGKKYEAEFKKIEEGGEVALLELDDSITFSKDVQPIKLVSKKPKENDKAVFISYVQVPNMDRVLGYSKADTQVSSNEECKKLLKNRRSELERFESHTHTICTKPFENACPHDDSVLIVNDQFAGFSVGGFLIRYDWMYNYVDISHLTKKIEKIANL